MSSNAGGGGWKEIGTTVINPVYTIYNVCQSTANETRILQVSSSGSILVYAPTSNANYVGEIIYIANTNG